MRSALAFPLVSMDAARAARQIVRAVKSGESQPVLSLPANLMARFHGLFPGTTNRLLALVNHFLPSPEEQGFVKGEELQREIDSTLFQEATTLGSDAAARYQTQEVPES